MTVPRSLRAKLMITFLFPWSAISFLVPKASIATIPSWSLKKSLSTMSRVYMSQMEQEKKLIQELQPSDKKQILEPYDPFLIKEIDQVEQAIESSVDEMVEEPIGLWVARGLLLLVAILWGTNFASVKYLETLCFHPPCHHPPSEFAFARFGVAALASAPFLWNQNKGVILAGLECGVYICLGYFTQALALSYISAGQCAFICSLTVVVVPVLSFLLYRKPISISNVVSGILALAGVAVLEGLVDFTSEPAATSAVISAGNALSGGFWQEYKGDLLALGQPIGFGLAFMRIEHYVEKFKNVPNRVLTISAAQCLATGFISYLWVLYDYHGVFPNMEYMVKSGILFKCCLKALCNLTSCLSFCLFLCVSLCVGYLD